MHNNIACSPGILGTPMQEHSSAIAALVYESVRGVTRLAGGTTDAILAQPVPILEGRSSQEREAVLAVLNGMMGDYLATTANPLAIPMPLRLKGQPLTLERPTLNRQRPRTVDLSDVETGSSHDYKESVDPLEARVTVPAPFVRCLASA